MQAWGRTKTRSTKTYNGKSKRRYKLENFKNNNLVTLDMNANGYAMSVMYYPTTGKIPVMQHIMPNGLASPFFDDVDIHLARMIPISKITDVCMIPIKQLRASVLCHLILVTMLNWSDDIDHEIKSNPNGLNIKVEDALNKIMDMAYIASPFDNQEKKWIKKKLKRSKTNREEWLIINKLQAAYLLNLIEDVHIIEKRITKDIIKAGHNETKIIDKAGNAEEEQPPKNVLNISEEFKKLSARTPAKKNIREPMYNLLDNIISPSLNKLFNPDKYKKHSKQGWTMWKTWKNNTGKVGDYLAIIYIESGYILIKYIRILTKYGIIAQYGLDLCGTEHLILKLKLDLSNEKNIEEIKNNLKNAAEELEDFFG